MASRPSSPDLYVAEQAGTVRLIKVTEPTSGSTDACATSCRRPPCSTSPRRCSSAGSKACSAWRSRATGASSTSTTRPRPDGRTKVVEYELGDRTTVDTVDRAASCSRSSSRPPTTTAATWLIGPDGYLYVGLGDGGGAGDPQGRAQDPHDLLGSILRIDPRGRRPRRRPRLRHPGGQPLRRWQGRCARGLAVRRRATRGGSRSTPRPATSGSATSVRTSGRRSTDLPADAGFDAGRGANLGWDLMEGITPLRGREPAGRRAADPRVLP